MISWYKKFASQPHQPFFTSGMLFLILFISLFALNYSNIINLDSSILTYHAYSLIFVVFIQFFLGFLFVVFPKFLMQAAIDENIYMKQFFIYLFSSFGILLSLIFYSKITFIFQITLFIVQIMSFRVLYSIHKKSIINDKNDTKWVLISFIVGIISHFLFIASNLDFTYSFLVSKVSINSGFYLFLFMIVFTISQRMIPFFTKVVLSNYLVNRNSRLLEVLFSLLILKVILLCFENSKLNLLADIPIFLFLSYELFVWKLPIFKVPPIVWILYLGLYWILFAFFISIIQGVFAFINPDFFFEKVVLHTIAIGYFVTVLLGFGTRVTLGHSGRQIKTDIFVVVIFIAAQVLAFIRIFASISINFGLNYIFFIELSAILLVIVLIVWSCKYITILLENEKEVKKFSKWKAN